MSLTSLSDQETIHSCAVKVLERKLYALPGRSAWDWQETALSDDPVQCRAAYSDVLCVSRSAEPPGRRLNGPTELSAGSA